MNDSHIQQTANLHLYPAWPILIVDDEEAALHTTRIALASGGITRVELCQNSLEVCQCSKIGEILGWFCLTFLCQASLDKSFYQR